MDILKDYNGKIDRKYIINVFALSYFEEYEYLKNIKYNLF